VLLGTARDTWKFYRDDLDPNTHLPLDNLGPDGTRGTYTSAANIGVYLSAVVSARDLGLVSRRQADSLVSASLTTVKGLKRSSGLLYQWYDTGNRHVIRNPGDIDCAREPTPTQDNCYLLSAVDNGWYAGNQPTGQMFGAYDVAQGPAGYHNGALYSDPRIAMYIGMGLHQMPGDVWWRTWRTLPPKRCDTDPAVRQALQ
jgi:hypothetical protein